MSDNEPYYFSEEQEKIAEELTWGAVSSIEKVERLSLEPGEVLAVIVKDADAPVAQSVRSGLAELLGVPIDRVAVIRGDVELRVLKQEDTDA